MQKHSFQIWLTDIHRADTGRMICGGLEQTRQDLVAVIDQYTDLSLFYGDEAYAFNRSPDFEDFTCFHIQSQIDSRLLTHELHEFVMRAAGDQFAMIHNGNMVREFLNLFHIMSRIENGHALVF